MRVLFVTQYGNLAASSRTRVFQYLPFLRSRGIQCDVITVLPDRAIGGSQIEVTRNPLSKLAYYGWASWRTLSCGLTAWWRARRADVLFVQKVILPRPVRWLLRCCRPPLVFDFDDAIFTTEVRKGQNWLAALKERRNSRGVPAMLRLADRAVVENPYTAEYARAYCPTTTITGPIDTERYRAREEDRSSDEVVLGWIGSATSGQYLELIREPLRQLARRFPELRLRVIGAPTPDVEGLAAECSEWSLETEADELRGFDIGLMPIADDPWTRGKGGYKLLQYMATGLPVVSSPVGVNCEIVREGLNGFLARDPVEWEDRLARLIADPELRRAMGSRGRDVVEREYSLSVQQQQLLDMLEQVGQRA